MNFILEKLPRHLMQLVIDQPYNSYTSQNHAVWRYVMRQNVRYLSKVAHGSYMGGLKRTGISIDSIPHMYGMNRILKEIGWAAVAVDGFIPPSAFMEFQAYNVLVIAADIRPIDQIEYTPAPDIIHEAAGHAPIIADPEYAEYLKLFGQIGSKAFSSARDFEIYEAVRHLSILKANPYTTPDAIVNAEKELAEVEAIQETASEMSRIRNLHWWTVEYGLIGDLKSPKIYGAGLLSSIGESYSSLQPLVKKIPYTIKAADYNFDITTRQPQLFVTPDFQHLTDVLLEFEKTMALQTGGVDGVMKAIESGYTGTCVYSSGLQVSGTFQEMIIHQETPVYIKTEGPTQLCFENLQLEGHGKDYHSHGFSSPVGKLKDVATPLEMLTDGELMDLGLETGKTVMLTFESGVIVKGNLQRIWRKNGRIILLTFTDCTVTFRDRVLFKPEWGNFDMAVGEKIVSAFSGPADPYAFELEYPVPKEKTHKIIHSPDAIQLHSLYQAVREIRENGAGQKKLHDIWPQLCSKYPEEWLLPLEILEISAEGFQYEGLQKEVREYLDKKKAAEPGLKTLIDNGYAAVSGLNE
ncbi:MAG: aromatic amino acid hydroxylase [Bacteroidales bacterium]|nr:aromatic amino acid hydroxylase [Bacteroidales bacterium]